MSDFKKKKLEGSQTTHDHRDRIKQFTFDHCYLSLNRNDPQYASQQIVNLNRIRFIFELKIN